MIGNIGGQSGGGSLTKSILIVTAPTGSTVTVTKGSTTKTATEKNGEWWFKGLENGEWTIRATLGGQNATAAYKIEQFGVYRTSIAYFKATINVTYPAGSTCTATDGKTTLNAPDTSGTWACIVPNAGEWTVGTVEYPSFRQSVTIISDGQVEYAYANRMYLYRDGNECIPISGGWRSYDVPYETDVERVFPTIKKNHNNLTIVGFSGSESGSGLVRAVNKIEMKNYSKLVFDGTISDVFDIPERNALNIWSKIGSTTDQFSVAKAQAKPHGTLNGASIDVSKLVGNYYIGFTFRRGGTSHNPTAVMENLYVEV